MDKLDYIKTTEYKLFNFVIFKKTENYNEIFKENADQIEILVRLDYYNREFNTKKEKD